jgi:predicted transcriptional regulator
MKDENPDMILEVTTEVVSAYVSKNQVPRGNLSNLIASVSASLSGLGRIVEAEKREPAVNPKKSVFADYIVCLEDGKRFKSLKRHLASLGFSPAEYRAKWNLPPDYPMVAPAYAARRSELAKLIGLGHKRTKLANAKKAPAKRSSE